LTKKESDAKILVIIHNLYSYFSNFGEY